MNYYIQKEQIVHKTEKFPLAHYIIDSLHPRYVMRHHWHPEFEIVYVKSGTLNLTLDRKEFKLSGGNFAIITPGTIHSAIPTNCSYECIVFDFDAMVGTWKFSNTYFSGFATDKFFIQQIYTFPEGLPEKELFKIFEILKTKTNGYELPLVSTLLSLFYTLIQTNCIKENNSSFSHLKLTPFNKSITYIEENYKEHISLESLAKSAGISPKYFSEYFKKMTSKSPFDYINEFRIERAAEMLIYTKKTITDISMDCGFSDLSYFCKTFKNYKQKTPRQYREEFLTKGGTL